VLEAITAFARWQKYRSVDVRHCLRHRPMLGARACVCVLPWWLSDDSDDITLSGEDGVDEG